MNAVLCTFHWERQRKKSLLTMSMINYTTAKKERWGKGLSNWKKKQQTNNPAFERRWLKWDMTKSQKWPRILCLTLGMWIPAMALCRVPCAPAGGSPCPWDASSSDTCFSFSKHDIRQGFNYASCPNLLSCHYKGLQWVLSLGLLKGKESISQRLRNYLLRASIISSPY